MKNEANMKDVVLKKYDEIAKSGRALKVTDLNCCVCDSDEVYDIMTEDYNNLKGYQTEADLGLGCGLPTQYAGIQKGDTVVDLGSGAGNDCFVARNETGETGKVVGVDFAPSMIERAENNAKKLGFQNVEFVHGDIEQIPLDDEVADVVVSNCVLNLVPNKEHAFSEVFRILKPGGHFSISDIVTQGKLPDSISDQAELYVGCVSGAIPQDEYIQIIKNLGFADLSIQKRRQIELPRELLTAYLNDEEIDQLNSTEDGIYSLTISAKKPVPCCDTECCP